MSLKLSAPQPLAATHRLNDFECGENTLDEWLKRRAMNNQLSGVSRTFVVIDEENRVHGSYAMAVGAVAHPLATSAVRRNMPDPIPVMVLGRQAGCGSPGTRHQAGCSHAARCGEPRLHGIAEHRGSRVAGACTQRTGQAVLRALRLSGIAAAPDDVDASPEYSQSLI